MAATPTDPTYIVNGRKEDSAVFPRRDIHDLQANAPEQFSLFILALTAVQYPTAGVPLLPPTFKAQGLVPEGGYWYNLGGIHGIPYSRYVGDPPSGDLSEIGAAATAQAAAPPVTAPPAAAPQSTFGITSTKPADSPAGLGGGLLGNIAAGVGQAAGGVVKGATDVGTGVVGGIGTVLGGAAQTTIAAVDIGTSPLNLLGAGTTAAPPPVQKASTAPAGEQRYGGYCNHASVLFPPWHRPYLLALEQSIGIAATKIAEQLVKGINDPTQAAKWTQAAKELRWPYWDWTDPIVLKDGLPVVLKDATVPIVSPAGTTELVPNPLAFYKFSTPLDTQFQDIVADVPFTDGVKQEALFSKWDRTYRWPGATATPTDDYTKVDQELKRLWPDLRAKVAHLFTYENEPDPNKWSLFWDEFSNTTVQSDPSKGGSTTVSKSLEAAHNSIHIIVGGVGHMGQNDYAGFDPIFWMHHANVDRIYALWEYCFKDYWVGAGYNDKDSGKFSYFTQPTGGTYYQLDHSRLDQATDMLPFRKARDAYWTPQDARSLENSPDVFPKYYSYPVIDGVDVTKPVSEQDRVKYRAIIQAHFGLREDVDQAKNRTTAHPSPFFSNPIVDILIPRGINAIANYKHFIVSVLLNEHAFNDSYSFELEYKPSADEPVVQSHVAVLSRPKNTHCAACQGRFAEGNIVRGMIHIPSTHVVSVLNSLVPGQPTGASEDTDAEVIKSTFSAKLVGRGGHVFATARAGQVVSEADRLDAVITPSVKFFSANAGLDALFGAEGPISFFNWQDHKEVFTNCWKKGSA